MTENDRLDSLGVWAAVASRGLRVEQAAATAGVLMLPSAAGITSVVIDVAAGSSTPGDVGHAVAAIAGSSAAVPIVPAAGDRSWIGAGAVLITDDARTAARGRSSGAAVVELGATISPATRGFAAHEALDGGGRFVAGVAASLVILDRLALIGEIDVDVEQAVAMLGATLATGSESRLDLARRIGRTMPIVYATGPIGSVAAARWKAAVNRYAKAPAFANSVPGLDLDEVCGWAQHGDVTRQVMTLVTLRHGFEQADDARRLTSTAETCEEIVADVHEVAAGSGSAFGQLLELATIGELVALEMAVLAGIDPGPLPVLDRY